MPGVSDDVIDGPPVQIFGTDIRRIEDVLNLREIYGSSTDMVLNP